VTEAANKETVEELADLLRRLGRRADGIDKREKAARTQASQISEAFAVRGKRELGGERSAQT